MILSFQSTVLHIGLNKDFINFIGPLEKGHTTASKVHLHALLVNRPFSMYKHKFTITHAYKWACLSTISLHSFVGMISVSQRTAEYVYFIHLWNAFKPTHPDSSNQLCTSHVT